MSHGATTQLATEPDMRGTPDVPVPAYRRAAKFVGDLLWFMFLTAIFTSISIGIAAELIL